MATIPKSSFRLTGLAVTPLSPVTVASRLAASADLESFSETQELVAEHPTEPESFLLMAIAAQRIGQPEFAAQTLRVGLGVAPTNPMLQVLNVVDEVESGRFELDTTTVRRIISSNLEIEDTLFDCCQAIFLGTERTVTLDLTFCGVVLPWTIQRTPGTVRAFGSLYHWMPKFHNSVENVDVFYQNDARNSRFNDPRNEQQNAFFTTRVAVADGMEVLDAGCGSGTLLKAFSDIAAIEAVGVDISSGAEPYFKANCPKGRFWAGDMVAIPFDDSSFDLVVSTDTLEHAFKPAAIVREIVRVAKPGALVAISVPDGRTDRYIGHVNYFSGQSLEFLLEDSGSVDVEYYGGHVFALLTVEKH